MSSPLFVLVGVAVVVVIPLVGVAIAPLLYWWSPLLPLVAELVLDYLVTDMQSVHVPD